MSHLYDEDVVLWSERQAALLRRVASGELVNDPDLDWPNIIEEVESVGRDELRSVESFLIQALLHVLKIRAWPNSPAVPGWREEVRRLRLDVQDNFLPSMRQRIDIGQVYARALKRMPPVIDGVPPGPVPSACFVTLDQILDPVVEIA